MNFKINNKNIYSPLKLRAEDDKDLEILSKCLFEAICLDNEMTYLKDKKSFMMSVERFTWELGGVKDENVLQVLCLIEVTNVNSIVVENFFNEKSKGINSLMSIAYDTGFLMFTFEDQAFIKINVSKLEIYVEDFGTPIKPVVVPSRK